jgi:FkbM family methyltransferase
VRLPGIVRRVTDPLVIGMRIPILSGTNRGRWWSLISAGSGHGTGRRTRRQLELLARLLRSGDVVWDVGAHHGFVTLCASRVVGATGQVHSFEPSALNREILGRHKRWNDARNVSIHRFALSDFDGRADFGGGGTSKTYSLGGGAETVQVRRGDSIVAERICPAPTFVKIDVEGAEEGTLAGLLAVLPRDARLLIAMHRREADSRCEQMLHEARFLTVPSRALVRCREGEWVSDPDLFCIGPDTRHRAEDLELLRAANF